MVGKITEFKSTHPWLTEEIVQSQARKKAAEGTEQEVQTTLEHSDLVRKTREEYIQTTRSWLQTIKKSSKLWWRKAGNILGVPDRVCSIPALTNDEDNWVMDSKGKANLFAKTFSSKYVLPEMQENEYSELKISKSYQDFPLLPTVERAEQILEALNESSGTGPDDLPARILKRCAKQLALPVALLTFRILGMAHWPEVWLTHWMVPIFKRGGSAQR